MCRAQLYTSKRELKGSRFFVAHGKNERKVRPREQNFEVLQTLAEVEAGTARTLTHEEYAQGSPV